MKRTVAGVPRLAVELDTSDRWDWNGPEEGDKVDLSVIIMHDGEEVIELTDSGDHTVAERKKIANALCIILNEAGAIAL